MDSGELSSNFSNMPFRQLPILPRNKDRLLMCFGNVCMCVHVCVCVCVKEIIVWQTQMNP